MPAEIVRVPYTDQQFEALQNINFHVNHGARYETDQDQYGVPDFWAEISPAGFGDCEDYCLTKMKMLRASGWPLGSLDIAVAKVPADGSYHALLVAHFDRGDWILDNNQDAVLGWKSAPYKFVQTSVGGDLLAWQLIE